MSQDLKRKLCLTWNRPVISSVVRVFCRESGGTLSEATLSTISFAAQTVSSISLTGNGEWTYLRDSVSWDDSSESWLHNHQSGFNVTDGTFTAPIEGNYFFICNGQLSGVADETYRVSISRNGEPFALDRMAGGVSGDCWNHHNCHQCRHPPFWSWHCGMCSNLTIEFVHINAASTQHGYLLVIQFSILQWEQSQQFSRALSVLMMAWMISVFPHFGTLPWTPVTHLTQQQVRTSCPHLAMLNLSQKKQAQHSPQLCWMSLWMALFTPLPLLSEIALYSTQLQPQWAWELGCTSLRAISSNCTCFVRHSRYSSSTSVRKLNECSLLLWRNSKWFCIHNQQQFLRFLFGMDACCHSNPTSLSPPHDTSSGGLNYGAGVFVAPVSGTFLISCVLGLSDVDMGSSGAAITVDGTRKLVAMETFAPPHSSISVTWTVSLSTGLLFTVKPTPVSKLPHTLMCLSVLFLLLWCKWSPRKTMTAVVGGLTEGTTGTKNFPPLTPSSCNDVGYVLSQHQQVQCHPHIPQSQPQWCWTQLQLLCPGVKLTLHSNIPLTKNCQLMTSRLICQLWQLRLLCLSMWLTFIQAQLTLFVFVQGTQMVTQQGSETTTVMEFEELTLELMNASLTFDGLSLLSLGTSWVAVITLSFFFLFRFVFCFLRKKGICLEKSCVVWEESSEEWGKEVVAHKKELGDKKKRENISASMKLHPTKTKLKQLKISSNDRRKKKKDCVFLAFENICEDISVSKQKKMFFNQQPMQEQCTLFFFCDDWMIFEFLQFLFCWVKSFLGTETSSTNKEFWEPTWIWARWGSCNGNAQATPIRNHQNQCGGCQATIDLPRSLGGQFGKGWDEVGVQISKILFASICRRQWPLHWMQCWHKQSGTND